MMNLKLKEMFPKLVTIVLLILSLASFAKAAIGEESLIVVPGRDLRIGIFHGTFDPPHLGHQKIADLALIDQAVGLDYILFIPNDQTFYKPNATLLPLRVQMAKLLFTDHPKIVVPHMDTDGELGLLRLLQRLRAQLEGHVRFVGIVGTDNVLANRPEGIFNDADPEIDEWLVNRRGGDTTPLPATLQGKPTFVFSAGDGGVASSGIKKALAAGSGFHGLSDEIIEFIKKQGLYGQGADAKWACRAVLVGP